MGYLKEYLEKNLSPAQISKELFELIKKYNDYRKTYLFIYASAMNKKIEGIQLEQEDYYIIRDFLTEVAKKKKELDFFIQTPGGKGETAEEIVEYLRENFEKINFVVSGEAKSAGTIMVMSGDEIFMTETGSLGPIDAQVSTGKTRISAYDYVDWVNKKRDEAAKNNELNLFDKIIIAQINPGELLGIEHSLEYAKDLVIDWLANYKFKNWNKRKTSGAIVTEQEKLERAYEIAEKLCDHSHWRSHGRSINRKGLDGIGLLINNVDDDPTLADMVYRIHMLLRLYFDTTPTYKLFMTADHKVDKHASTGVGVQTTAKCLDIDLTCEGCGKIAKFFATFEKLSVKEIRELEGKSRKPIPKNLRYRCRCGFEDDFTPLKNDLEAKTGKKLHLE